MIFKVAIIGVTGVLLSLFLKDCKNKIHICISMAVSLIILFYITEKLGQIISKIQYISSIIPIENEYITIMFRILGIAYITQFASDLCKDAGESAIAGQIELFSKVSIATVSMPIVFALFEVITTNM